MESLAQQLVREVFGLFNSCYPRKRENSKIDRIYLVHEYKVLGI